MRNLSLSLSFSLSFSFLWMRGAASTRIGSVVPPLKNGMEKNRFSFFFRSVILSPEAKKVKKKKLHRWRGTPPLRGATCFFFSRSDPSVATPPHPEHCKTPFYVFFFEIFFNEPLGIVYGVR